MPRKECNGCAANALEKMANVQHLSLTNLTHCDTIPKSVPSCKRDNPRIVVLFPWECDVFSKKCCNMLPT